MNGINPAEFERIHLIDFPPLKESDNGKTLHPFYKVAFSREWKDTAITLLLNEIRKSNPDKDSDERNRATLAKLKSYGEMIDIEAAIREIKKQEEPAEDELPDDASSSFRPDAYLEDNN
jgi:hypothetical protein